MKVITLSFAVLSTLLLCSLEKTYALGKSESVIHNDGLEMYRPSVRTNDKPKIQVALLLDTSSSMDGLIDQAKSRLWNIVNTLSTLKFKGKSPLIEIALYEYGNNNLEPSSGYIRMVAPLTQDLDLISSKLFSLTTYGGEEYCGQVIQRSLNQLAWSNGPNDIKLVYIAGNEHFDQGPESYKIVIPKAVEKNIFVHTIHCGSYQAGVNDQWQAAAQLSGGKFFNINSDRKVRHITTPFDQRISECNTLLNQTYISYGAEGHARKENQLQQDRNAASMSQGNMTERALTKSKPSMYHNANWDLVDKSKDDKHFIKNIKKEDLPASLQNKSPEELEELVSQKRKEREALQLEMEELGKKRQAFINEKMNEKPEEDDLGQAINSSLLELAFAKGYQQL